MEELNQFLSHQAVQQLSISAITSDRYLTIASILKQQGTSMLPPFEIKSPSAYRWMIAEINVW